MARLLLAWELGANFGHIAPLRLLARELIGQGHACVFAVRDLAASLELVEPELGPVLQAPIRGGESVRPVAPVSYASLLHNTGCDDPAGLAARLHAWRRLLQEQRCERLVANHAPTALLAARTLGLPALHFGSGFTVPPLATPFRAYDPQAVVDDATLARNEAATLGVINAALQRLGLAPLERIQQIVEGATPRVTSYAEMDHYPGARAEPYLGLPDIAHGATPAWAGPREPRVFAYLRPFDGLPAVLRALRQLRAQVLVRIGGVAASALQEFTRPGMLIVDRAVNLRLAARDCDLYVNYAAHATTCEMLLAGKPGLLLPDTMERRLVARRAVQLGAALAPADDQDFDLGAALRRLLDDPAPRAGAEAFAQRYAGRDRADVVAQLARAALAPG